MVYVALSLSPLDSIALSRGLLIGPETEVDMDSMIKVGLDVSPKPWTIAPEACCIDIRVQADYCHCCTSVRRTLLGPIKLYVGDRIEPLYQLGVLDGAVNLLLADLTLCTFASGIPCVLHSKM